MLLLCPRKMEIAFNYTDQKIWIIVNLTYTKESKEMLYMVTVDRFLGKHRHAQEIRLDELAILRLVLGLDLTTAHSITDLGSTDDIARRVGGRVVVSFGSSLTLDLENDIRIIPLHFFHALCFFCP